MSLPAAIRLVKSLSKSEKRHFKLFTKKQSGARDYLDLFDLIDQNNFLNKDLPEKKFEELHSGHSLNNTARYLLTTLTDCLIQSRIKEDDLFRLMHGLLRVTILNERNLPDEGYKELKKLQMISSASQEKSMQYSIYRNELNYLAEINFRGCSEKELIKLQMDARDTLKDLRNTHEHHSLYELLKYRLIHSGKSVSETDRKQLNDLLLGELSIVNAKVKNNLESRKLHLLFQSFFFTNIGDYKSALKTFHELNRLFEKNASQWSYPPSDYLSAIEGILDSLRSIGRFEEMSLYIRKLEQLNDLVYPEYFLYMVRKSVMTYRLILLINTKELEKAIQYIEKSDPQILKAYNLVDVEKQSELVFYFGLVYFKVKNYKKSQKYINEIVLLGKISYESIIYRASRLLNIIIHYEVNNLEYLDYEIRSFKRGFLNKGKQLKVESLIFKTIKFHPKNKPVGRKDLLWKKIEPVLAAVEKDKYEMQLRKYFDFSSWIKRQFISTVAGKSDSPCPQPL